MSKLQEMLDKTPTTEERLQFSDMCINADFMQLVYKLMKKHKVKKKELAAGLGISKKKLNRMFSGDKYFDVRFITKVQNYFNFKFEFKIEFIDIDEE